jgi:CheY-like chemotaxis protein
MTTNENGTPRLVLIDDDPTYCTIMSRIAGEENISLTTFTSLEEMGTVGRLADFDVALVDYDLGGMNGIEVGEYINSFFKNKPMVLVSGSNRKDLLSKKWPPSIKAFVCKTEGYRQVLRKALVFSGKRAVIPRALHFGER